MNESALNALINLFAVFSVKSEKNYETAKASLEEYLIQRLGIKDPDEYVSLFYELVDLYSIGPHLLTDEKTVELATRIGSQIKSRIHHRDQIIIFLHFLDLAHRDLLTIGQNLYDRIAEIFEINPEDYRAFRQFIFCLAPAEIEEPGFLVINSRETGYHPANFHLRNETLRGDILVYYVSEIRQFIFKYFGDEALFLEGNSIRTNHFYIFNQGGIIRSQLKTNIYYSDISRFFFNQQLKNSFVFSGESVSYHFPGSRNGIQPFTFSEKSGQMIAVMGGSGVGKSTLLNVLNGTLPLKTGRVAINGIDIHADYDRIEGLIGYIPQDDLVIEELTVFENVFFNAQLCLNSLPGQEVTNQVTGLLKDLDLFGVKDMKVGNPLNKQLSGGQRKRLNIALELIREPSILFVDEPTSGLSSKDSEKIMVLLKQQAQQGRLIIVNIHQPSSFIYKLFDKLWVFDRGGYPIYAGNPLDAIIYFKDLAGHIDAEHCECNACGNVNPEQVLEIIETQKFDESGKLTEERKFTPEEFHDIYKKKIQDNTVFEITDTESPVSSRFVKPPGIKQFRIFFNRNFKAKISNVQYIIINVLQAPLLALVVSLLTRYTTAEGYYFGLNKNFPSFIFMSIVVMLFQGMSLSAEEIIRDRTLLQRESFLRLSRLSYLNSKILFLFGVSLVQSLLFLLISSWVLQIDGLFLQYWLILFLTAAFANMVGLNISSGLNSVVTIYISIPLLIIPQILLCGLIVQFDDLQPKNARHNVVPVIGDLMASRWAYEALAVEQFSKNRYTVHYFDVDKEMSDYFIKGELIIPKLSNLIQTVAHDPSIRDDRHLFLRKIETIREEFKQLERDSLVPAISYYKLINNKQLNLQVADSAIAHLDRLRTLYKQLYRSAEQYKDQITSGLIGEIGEDDLLELKKRQHNTSLSSLLIKENATELVVTGYNRLHVRVAPIYRDPESTAGRAHFYAPAKQVGQMEISTFGFNSMIITLMILFLYISLYYDWLKKTITTMERFSLRKRKRN